MIKIEHIKIGLPPTTVTSILIRPLINSTSDTYCSVEYEVYSENMDVIYKERLFINEENYSAWGADNAFIEDLVLKELGLTRDLTPVPEVITEETNFSQTSNA